MSAGKKDICKTTDRHVMNAKECMKSLFKAPKVCKTFNNWFLVLRMQNLFPLPNYSKSLSETQIVVAKLFEKREEKQQHSNKYIRSITLRRVIGHSNQAKNSSKTEIGVTAAISQKICQFTKTFQFVITQCYGTKCLARDQQKETRQVLVSMVVRTAQCTY